MTSIVSETSPANFDYTVTANGKVSEVASATFEITVLSSWYGFGGLARNIKVKNNYAYVAKRFGGLEIYDVTIPAIPVLISRTNAGTEDAHEVEISIDENTAYIANYQAGFIMVDVTNPASPGLIANFQSQGNGHGVAISNDENTAYLANDSNGLVIIDITTPVTPLEK